MLNLTTKIQITPHQKVPFLMPNPPREASLRQKWQFLTQKRGTVADSSFSI
jgi:hypothetical protein